MATNRITNCIELEIIWTIINQLKLKHSNQSINDDEFHMRKFLFVFFFRDC